MLKLIDHLLHKSWDTFYHKRRSLWFAKVILCWLVLIPGIICLRTKPNGNPSHSCWDIYARMKEMDWQINTEIPPENTAIMAKNVGRRCPQM